MRTERSLTERQKEVNLRHQKKSCHSCRYFRLSAQGSNCLFLGRVMGSRNSNTRVGTLVEWAQATICDAWKKRPSTWKLYVKDPFWCDPHITTETQRRFRR